jgi:hypothetical protein
MSWFEVDQARARSYLEPALDLSLPLVIVWAVDLRHSIAGAITTSGPITRRSTIGFPSGGAVGANSVSLGRCGARTYAGVVGDALPPARTSLLPTMAVKIEELLVHEANINHRVARPMYCSTIEHGVVMREFRGIDS